MEKEVGSKRFSKLINSKILRLLFGLFLSGLTLYLSFKNVKISEAIQAVYRIELLFVILAFLAVCASLLLKAIRWNLILQKSEKKISFYVLFLPFMLAKMLNIFIPASLGEMTRIFAFRNEKQSPGSAFVMGTLVIEKWLDYLSFTVLLLALFFSLQMPDWIGRSGYLFVLITLLITLISLGIIYRRDWMISNLEKVLKFFPDKIANYFNQHLISGLSSFDSLSDGFFTFKLFLLSILIWVMSALINQFMLFALDITLPFTTAILLMIALQVGISLPSMPASIGIFEYICVLTLGFFGIEESIALSFGVLLHVIAFLPTIIGGLISFWIMQFRKTQQMGIAEANTKNYS